MKDEGGTPDTDPFIQKDRTLSVFLGLGKREEDKFESTGAVERLLSLLSLLVCAIIDLGVPLPLPFLYGVHPTDNPLSFVEETADVGETEVVPAAMTPHPAERGAEERAVTGREDFDSGRLFAARSSFGGTPRVGNRRPVDNRLEWLPLVTLGTEEARETALVNAGGGGWFPTLLLLLLVLRLDNGDTVALKFKVRLLLLRLVRATALLFSLFVPKEIISCASVSLLGFIEKIFFKCAGNKRIPSLPRASGTLEDVLRSEGSVSPAPRAWTEGYDALCTTI